MLLHTVGRSVSSEVVEETSLGGLTRINQKPSNYRVSELLWEMTGCEALIDLL